MTMDSMGGEESTLLTSAADRADREQFVLKVDAALRTLVRLKYFSWEIEGVENLPRRGPVVFVQNHAGWFALDTMLVGCSIAEAIGVARAPYFAAHDAALRAPVIGPFLRRIGGVPASLFRHPERLPAEIESFGICPEGVQGNCKPFWEAYRMRAWSRAFVNLAVARKAPVVPVSVLGGEECLPVAWTVRVLEPLIGSVVGLPVVPVPLPARWRVVFHEPVYVVPEGSPPRLDSSRCKSVARQVQHVVQEALDREAQRRPLARLSSFVSIASETLRPESRGRLAPAATRSAASGRPMPVACATSSDRHTAATTSLR